MKKLMIQCLFSVTSLCGAVVHAQTYPVIPPGTTHYVVPAQEATGLVIDTLYLPKGFTLSFGPGVQSIDWTVRNIKFEQGATIDLSTPRVFTLPPGARMADGGPPPRQADYCQIGAAGAAGTDGPSGDPGKDLTLRGVENIQGGDLWIKTDGDLGLNGGNGGNGQQGGGPKGGGPGGVFPLITKPCGAGHGGAGGRAGQGGKGGRVGQVTISFRYQNAVPPKNQVGATCGPTQRPADLNNNGVIDIYGAPGCDGKPGTQGKPGIGG